MPETALPRILETVPLGAVERITASLEGDWSPHAVEIWRREVDGLDLSAVARRHASYRPSLELHLATAWIGVPCFVWSDGHFVFDEDLARAIVRRVAGASPPSVRRTGCG